MTEYRFAPAEQWHAEDLAPKMRAADRAEIWASNMVTPLQALSLGVQMPDTVAAIDNEGCFMMFGAAPLSPLSDTAAPWMLGADRLITRHRAMIRQWSPYVVAEMLRRYRRLENYVDPRNVVSVKWIRWLGYTVEPVAPYGPYGHMFHKFWKER